MKFVPSAAVSKGRTAGLSTRSTNSDPHCRMSGYRRDVIPCGPAPPPPWCSTGCTASAYSLACAAISQPMGTAGGNRPIPFSNAVRKRRSRASGTAFSMTTNPSCANFCTETAAAATADIAARHRPRAIASRSPAAAASHLLPARGRVAGYGGWSSLPVNRVGPPESDHPMPGRRPPPPRARAAATHRTRARRRRAAAAAAANIDQ
jgi:hypothetical protein